MSPSVYFRVKQAERELGEGGLDWRGALIASPLGSLMTHLPLQAGALYGIHRSAPRTFSEARQNHAISRKLLAQPEFSSLQMKALGKEMSKDLQNMRRALPEGWKRWVPGTSRMTLLSSHYDPEAHAVNALRSTPGVLAHELGHARQDLKKWEDLYHKLPKTAWLPSMIQAYSGDRTTSRVAGGAAAAAALPRWLIELDASWRGRNMLRGVGVRGLKSWSPFVGLSSYSGAVLAPLVIQALKERGWARRSNKW